MLTVSPALLKLKSRYSVCASLHLLNLSYPNPTSPDLNTLSLLLQGHLPDSHLLQIHAQIFRIGGDQDNLIATRLIGHYPPQLALRVFHHLQKPNIFPFNAIIRVLSQETLLIHALSVFKTLKFLSLSPNDFTFSFLLKACFRCNDGRNIHQIHTHIVKLGFDRNSFVCNGLVAVYGKGLRDLVSGHRLFDEMPDKGMIITWTCLIAGYAKLGRSEEALTLFLRMIEENLKPDNDTMVSVLSACSSLEIQEIERWANIFTELGHNDGIKVFHLDFIDTVLVYLHGKWGKIDKSRDVFDRIVKRGGAVRSLLPWNTMISGYVQNALPMEALALFQLMVSGPYPRPNHVTMVSLLSACAQVGDLDLGRWIHRCLKIGGCKGILESNTFLATALIDMYSKCGSLESAKKVFDQMVAKDVVSFNAMIMGFAINGRGEEALMLFSKMEEFGVYPNGGTFLGLLSACNHSGMVGEGHWIFLNMVPRHSVIPQLEHYACYIDLLARIGHIEEALDVVSSMPVKPNSIVWGALLGGCLAHSRADLVQYIAQRLVRVEPNNSASYVMLSNVYASDHRWGEISEVRGLMRVRGVKKQPGCSWISVNGVVHEFLVGSTAHPQIQRICSTLDGLFKEMRSLGP